MMPREQLRNRSGAIVTLCATVLFAFMLNGCASSQRAGGDSIGIALDLLVEQDDSIALYRVADDGTISFAGGYDARMRRFTWTDDLTQQEISSLRTILEARIWNDRRRDRGEVREGERRSTIMLHAPQRNRIIVHGQQPQEVQDLEELLVEAAARRFEHEIEALPKPGPLP